MGLDNRQKILSRAELGSLVEREFPSCSVALRRFGYVETRSSIKPTCSPCFQFTAGGQN